MADYSEEINDAIEMIAEFGGPVLIESTTEYPPDTNKPWHTEVVEYLLYSVVGVTLEFKKSQQSQGFTAGSEDTRFVLPGDMVVYIAACDPAITFEPKPRDLVTPPGDIGTYNVVDTHVLAPNGQKILYKLWIRK